MYFFEAKEIIMKDTDIEQEIIEKGLTAPRVTTSTIDDLVESLKYHSWNVPNTTTTLVAAELDGFIVTVGKSASVSKDNFNAEIGYKIARDDAERKARDKLWELKGWELKQQLKATT